MAYRILKTCCITIMYCCLWMILEGVIYGQVEPRIVDDIIMAAFIPLIWKATTKVKDDCGRDYVKRTGKCPICTDCPHNCPLENNDLEV